MNDENDCTFTLTTRSISRRRSCIQNDKRGLEEEEDTKKRKSRRVSFSSRIQVKTIDDSVHDPNSSKDKITLENTNANKHLTDISNQFASTDVSISIQKEVTTTSETKIVQKPITVDANETIMPIRNYLDVSNLNQTNLDASQQNVSMDLVNNSNSFINITQNQTICDMTTCNVSIDLNQTKMIQDGSLNFSSFHLALDQTKSSGLSSSDSSANETKLPFNDITMATSRVEETVLTDDESMNNDKTLEGSPVIELKVNCLASDGLSAAYLSNTASEAQINDNKIVNQTYTTESVTELTENTRRQANKSTINLIDATYIHEPKIHEMTLPTQSDVSRVCDYGNHSIGASNISMNTSKLLQSMQHTSINELETSQTALDLTVGGYSEDDVSQFLQSNFEENRELLQDKIEEMKRFKVEIEKVDNNKKLREQKMQNEIIMSKETLKSMKEKYSQTREKISQLKIKLGVEMLNKVDKENKEKEIELMVEKNEADEQSLKNAKQNLIDLREKVKSNGERIKSLQSTQIGQEKFLSLSEKIFNSSVIEYNLLNMEKDTILLSFFFDFIQIEIKATNIVNDLNSFQHHSSDLERLNDLLEKCGNYPLQKLTNRSLIDSVGNSIDSPFYVTEQDRNVLRRKNSKRVPVYIKYCVNLVLEDIGEGDLMSLNKRFKYIKDIPLLIAHYNLASRCATNLAKDFEYFANKCYDSEIKCEFDFKNHMVTITLPSLEDSCYYKLKLSILPGRYYQEAIPFSIEPVDSDDVFTPNIKRLSKVIEGQYFEDGSLRHFLRKLKLI